MVDVLVRPRYVIAYGRRVYVVTAAGDIMHSTAVGFRQVADDRERRKIQNRVRELDELER